MTGHISVWFFFWSFNPTGSNSQILRNEFEFSRIFSPKKKVLKFLFIHICFLFWFGFCHKQSYSLKKLWKFSTRSFGIGWLIRWTSYHQNIEIHSEKMRNKLSLSAKLDWIFQNNYKSQAWYHQMLQRDIFWKVIN